MKLSLDAAQSLVVGALLRSGVDADNAASVARALVSAEAAGQGGHGLRRVPAYSAQAKAGKVDGRAQPRAVRPRPSVLAIDAMNGFAYPALDLAVAELPAIAKAQGIAIASIYRSHHAGVMGLTVERFAEQGLAAMMFANAPASIAPWGGRKALYGTNPIAFSVPIAGGDPITVDLAISKVARGKIMAARQKGEAIPDDWAFDLDGKPTTDAELAMSGLMAPLGGAKGAALAMMVEILSAGITGANYAFEASSLFDDKGPPVALGQTIIAIDATATGGSGVFERLALLADEIDAQEGVRIPGRRGQGLTRTAEAEGIEIEDDVIAAIDAIA
ncbi:Ldh family oxidoreductase [Rhizobium sp. CECT 9324]|uniref:Ldh family oxidoreductase n=1 Tax=Rhizobium sp. CECT 9324 TaxID=2845820 RepID=UPI001E5E5B3E|nr:Ldh family oxidoreductase [Rhizobium sp. CECT 9324]CAH0341667.1 (2R)-3-sulfolactate dehydrogenase (NADP(+)) [Rhizobium sp. CECT 9324]